MTSSEEFPAGAAEPAESGAPGPMEDNEPSGAAEVVAPPASDGADAPPAEPATSDEAAASEDAVPLTAVASPAGAGSPSPTGGKNRQKRAATAVRMGGRLIAGTVVVAAAAAVVVATLVLPLPEVTAAAPRSSVDPTAGDTTLVCSESFLVTGRDAAMAQALSAAGTLALDAVDTAGVTESDIAVEGVSGAASRALTAPAVDGERNDIAGAGGISLTDADAAGYAASACRPAVSEGWFAGLDTRTGSAGVLVLTNPAAVASTVTLTAYGERGPIEPVTDLTVPAGEARAISVSAVVGAEFSPVIHLFAEGAPVQAVVQSTAVRGLTPVGLDITDPARSDATTQTYPGIVVSDVEGAATAVRLLATDADTTASLEVRNADGETVSEREIDLVAGIPLETDIDDLDAGTYDIVVVADAPVVGATWTTTGTATGADFAWTPAAAEITGTASFAVAAGPAARLRLVNSGDDDVTVTVTSGGTRRDVTVPSGGAAETKVTSSRTASVAVSDGGVAASVIYSGPTALATSVLWPADAASETVTVTR